MIQKKRAKKEQSPKTKFSQFKQQIRLKQIDNHFQYRRKQALNEHYHQQLEKITQKQAIAIDTLINNLNNQTEDAMFNLWQQCSTYSYRYFSKNHIDIIIQKLKTYTNNLKNKEQEILMGIWLIANWTFISNLRHFYNEELLKLLFNLLQQTNHQKLSQYIIFSLSNLCQNSNVGLKLMEMSIIDRLLKFSISLNTFGNVAAVLKRILKTLHFSYHFDQNTIQKLLNFLKYSLPRIQQDDYLRGDCIGILVRIMLANCCSYKIEIISHLQYILKQMIKGIQNLISLRALQDMFLLLSNIYRNPFPFDSILFDSQLEVFIWQFCQRLLEQYPHIGFAQDKKQLANLFQHVWLLLNNFIHFIRRPNRQKIFHWLKNQCLSEQSLQWQQKCISILVQNLQNDQLFQLVDNKIRYYLAIDHLIEAMLKAIYINLKDQISIKNLQTRKQLIQIITSMKYDQRELISSFAIKIIDKIEENKGKLEYYNQIFAENVQIREHMDFQEKKQFGQQQ